MKKSSLKFCVLVAFISLFSLSGCGKNSSIPESSTPDPSISDSNSSTPDPSTPIANSAPSIDTSFSTLALDDNSTYKLDLNISDADGDELTLSIDSNDSSLIVALNFTNPIAQGNYDGVTLDFNITSDYNITKDVVVTLVVSDGELNSTSSFDVNVTELLYWKEKEYRSFSSSYTGRIWLDRNLGASQVATSIDDNLSYGDYYQWGRETDGHEKVTSTTTTTLATTISDVGNAFISTTDDWTTAAFSKLPREASWSKTDGTSICPLSYRVPTAAEFTLELTQKTITTNIEAFDKLKFPSAGYRKNSDGVIYRQGITGYLNTSSFNVNGTLSYVFLFASEYANAAGSGPRSPGYPVRCIKD